LNSSFKSLFDFIYEKEYIPKVDYKEILKNSLSEICQEDWSYKKINFLYNSDIGFPSLYSEKIGKIALYVDTSGSISLNQINNFLQEIQILTNEFDLNIDLFLFSEDVYREFFNFKESIKEIYQSGTNFKKIFKHFENLQEEYKAILIYTDGMDFPFDCFISIPVYWLIFSDFLKLYPNYTPLFGEIINI